MYLFTSFFVKAFIVTKLKGVNTCFQGNIVLSLHPFFVVF